MLENITNAQGLVSWDSRVLNPEICQMQENKCNSQKPYKLSYKMKTMLEDRDLLCSSKL